MRCTNLQRSLLILKALLLPFLETQSQTTENTEIHETFPLPKVTNTRHDSRHGSKSTLKITRKHLHTQTPLSTEVGDRTKDLASIFSLAKKDTENDVSQFSTTLFSKVTKRENDIRHEIIPKRLKTDKTNKMNTTKLDIDGSKTNARRQFKSDDEIARLLKEYQKIVTNNHLPTHNEDDVEVTINARPRPEWQKFAANHGESKNYYRQLSSPIFPSGADFGEKDFTAPNRGDLGTPDGSVITSDGTTVNEAQGAATRFTTRMTTTRRRRRTTPYRHSLVEDCDYLAYYCLKAYETGKLCAVRNRWTYLTFENYCLMDYVNCMERYTVWQAAYMGECWVLKILTEYKDYKYNDETFLTSYFVIEDV